MDVSVQYSSFSGDLIRPVIVPAQPTGAAETIVPQSIQSGAAAGSAVSPAPSSEGADLGLGTGQQGTAKHATAAVAPLIGQYQRDITTDAMVYQEIDGLSKQVVLQVPDEHLLKLRNYVAELKRREDVSRHSRSIKLEV